MTFVGRLKIVITTYPMTVIAANSQYKNNAPVKSGEPTPPFYLLVAAKAVAALA
jgi:hypothetical protein